MQVEDDEVMKMIDKFDKVADEPKPRPGPAAGNHSTSYPEFNLQPPSKPAPASPELFKSYDA